MRRLARRVKDTLENIAVGIVYVIGEILEGL